MKKLLTITLTFCTFIVAMACGSNEPDVDGTTGATEQTGGDEGTAKGKMLVIYFSRADENWQVGYVERGNTAIMVDYIKELADVDVFEIVPVVAYPAVYDECTAYVTEEINENRRPAYKDDITNLADYETIFIGGPIWWGRPPCSSVRSLRSIQNWMARPSSPSVHMGAVAWAVMQHSLRSITPMPPFWNHSASAAAASATNLQSRPSVTG